MKIFMKGGPWKNVEDEILKSAVMKYGLHQWTKISTLLQKKSAKQCKARWYEWLDPSIKKTPWNRVEEEKLLHLVKIMPTQWKTIGQIVGRTSYQCMEHFEFLLDKYQKREEDYDHEDDPRFLKAGEIDYNAEHKPALPDPVDMDEDEKEMLSEARARFVNRMGKKERRRAREKRMKEERRLSLLRKRRELKSAGIYVTEEIGSNKKNRFKKIDFLKEIPYQKRVPAGYYDTLNEKNDSWNCPIERNINLIETNRKNDKRIRNIPNVLNQINISSEIEKRRKIELPVPQINDFNKESLDNKQVTNQPLLFYNRKLERKRQQLKREQLRSQFLNIPKPLQKKYYFKLNVNKPKVVQDKLDITEDREQRIFNNRSCPVKKSLTRPVKVNPEFYNDYVNSKNRNKYEQKAKLLICEEMKNLVDLDMKYYPVCYSLKKNQLRKIELEFDESDLIRSNEIIENEMEHFVNKIPSQQQFIVLWNKVVQNLVGNNLILENMNEKEKMKLLEENFKFFQEKFIVEKRKVQKLEKEVNILTKKFLEGYPSS